MDQWDKLALAFRPGGRPHPVTASFVCLRTATVSRYSTLVGYSLRGARVSRWIDGISFRC